LTINPSAMPSGEVDSGDGISQTIHAKHVEKQWSSFEELHGPESVQQRSTSLSILVRCVGLPENQRSTLWTAWSGAGKLKASASRSYSDYLALADTKQGADANPFYANAKAQIELDLLRTWPKDPRFKPGQPAITQLRRVLVAQCVRNSAVGYLQSMNFVACFLLVSTHFDEEASFWLLCALVEVLIPTFYIKDMNGVKSLVEDFSGLIAKKMPKLNAKMEQMHTSATFRSFAWFLTLFFGTLQPDVLTRVWDFFFYAAIEHEKDNDFGNARAVLVDSQSSSSSSSSSSFAAAAESRDGREFLCAQHCRCEAVLISTALGLLALNESVLMDADDHLEMATAVQDISAVLDCKAQNQKLLKLAFGGRFGSIKEVAGLCEASFVCRGKMYDSRLNRLHNLSKVSRMPHSSPTKHRRGSSHRQILNLQSHAFSVPRKHQVRSRFPKHRRNKTSRLEFDASAIQGLFSDENQAPGIHQTEDSSDVQAPPGKRIKQSVSHVSVVHNKHNRYESADFAFPSFVNAASKPSSSTRSDQPLSNDPLTPAALRRNRVFNNDSPNQGQSNTGPVSELALDETSMRRTTPAKATQRTLLQRRLRQTRSCMKRTSSEKTDFSKSASKFLDSLLSPKRRTRARVTELLPLSATKLSIRK
jgi:hypothetical protein